MMQKLGASMYVIWGVLHLKAAQATWQLGAGIDAGLLQARIYQSAFNLLFFAVAAIVIAVWLNWRNDKVGYWANLVMVSVVDIGFIWLVLAPGWIPVFPGILGPVFWVLAAIFSTIAYRQRV
jgi:hypothetical protein